MKKQTRKILAIAMAFTLVLANVAMTQHTSAAPLTQTYIRLNRMTTGTTTSFRLVFRTTATSSGATSVVINFNGADATTWGGSSGVVNGTQTVSSASCAAEVTGSTALAGSLTAAGASNTVTISGVTALSATPTLYCVDLTSASAVTNATAGEYHPTITVGSDSNTVAIRTVSNDSILVQAVVPPTFNFALSSNSDSFTTNLAAGSVISTTGVTATVNTNAKTGWIAWAKDSSTGLNSPTQAKTIASTTPGSSATLVAGTEGYVFGVTSITQGSGAGSTTAAAAYDATATGGVNFTGSGLDSTIRQIAQSTGTANTAVLTLKERAAINGVTPAAADYADTVTLIAAGSF